MSFSASPVTLAPGKKHFEILDGVRGIAAVSVVIFHFMEIAVPDYKNSFIAHAYLAVDFFFCLSGFVIAYAYDEKLKDIGLWTFFKLRLIRLHPLVLIGSIIGLLSFIFDPWSNLQQTYADKTVWLFLSSSLLIPYAIVHERYLNLFHLNAPSWSLFWEYIANITYALVLVRLRNKFLWMLAIIGAVAIFMEAKRSGFLGFGFGGDNIRCGAIRVFYSFSAGILIYRYNWIIKTNLGFIPVGVLLIGAFLVPFNPGLNWLVDPILVIFYLPLLVALGAGAKLKSRLSAICRFSGAISYPLYMVHYPFIWLFMSYVGAKRPNMDQMTTLIIIGTILLTGFAYLIMRMLDIPIRKYLTAKLRKSQMRPAAERINV